MKNEIMKKEKIIKKLINDVNFPTKRTCNPNITLENRFRSHAKLEREKWGNRKERRGKT